MIVRRTPQFRIRVAAALAVVAVMVSALAAGSGAAATRRDPRRGQIARAARQVFRAGGLNSMVFGVWVHGRLLSTGALGSAQQGVPATRGMHFRIGNVTETMTATLLLRFVQQHRVRLDARVSRWYPRLRGASRVTLRMLATSTSGYQDYVTSQPFINAFAANPFQRFSSDALIRLGTSGDPLFTPGRSWAFSDTNFQLLGAILQKIAHRPLAAELRRQIFHPLGLTQTALPSSSYLPPPVMHAYSTERGPYEESTYWTPSWVSLSGAGTSTLDDMGRWARALGTGTLLSRKLHALQLGPSTVGLGPLRRDRYYAYGEAVTNRWVVSNPQVDGYNGSVSYFAPKGIAVVVFSTLGPKSEQAKLYSVEALLRIARILTPRSMPKLSTGGRVH